MSTPAIPQFPAGHIGALTPDQQTKFDQFKQLCQSRNLYSPSSPEKRGLPSHDDPLLLRFLRARKWDMEGAYKQLEDTDNWRKDCDLDGVYRWIDRGEYEETRRLYPQWIGRRDKRGMPVYVFEVAHLSSKAVAAYEQSTKLKNAPPSHTSSTPAKLLRLFALYENLTNFALPLCTAATDRPDPHVPITQSNNIVDISGVGLKQFWELKAHLQDASTLATAHYPETLDRIFIIGAPSFFPTIWSWVKRWFDPIVVSKMFILSPSEVYPTLSKFMDPEDIPVKYGGKLQFEFGDMPNIGGGLEGLINWTGGGGGGGGGVPQGPILWQKGEGGRMDMVNLGSVNGERKDPVVGYIQRDWEGVLYPGSVGGGSGKGEAGSDKTATEISQGGGVDKGEVDTVPAAPTAPGPPVVA